MASIKCTNCGVTLKIPPGVAPGKRIKCPKCATMLTAPEEDEPPQEASEAEATPTLEPVPVTLEQDDDVEEDDYAPPRRKRKASRRAAEDDEDEALGKSSVLLVIAVTFLLTGCLFSVLCGWGGWFFSENITIFYRSVFK